MRAEGTRALTLWEKLYQVGRVSRDCLTKRAMPPKTIPLRLLLSCIQNIQ